MSKKSIDFEASLQQLETLVKQMESGDLTLEESLKSFEEGVKLTRVCQEAISKAEQKVRVLMEKSGVESLEPFDSPSQGSKNIEES